jgi:hypothetical protein
MADDTRHNPQVHPERAEAELGQPELTHRDLSQPEFWHEHRDVNVWAIGKFAIGLTLVAILAMGGLFWLYQFMLSQFGGKLQQTAVGFNADARYRPPAPQLEETPAIDWQRQLEAEEHVLNTYGWVDRKDGIVRIPIGRAIDLLVQQGLPSRQAAPVSPVAGVSVPTESGLGPKVQQVGGPLHDQLYGGANR